jgi:hypothetical protein
MAPGCWWMMNDFGAIGRCSTDWNRNRVVKELDSAVLSS